jgi:hypothetical protein
MVEANVLGLLFGALATVSHIKIDLVAGFI